MAKIKTFSLLSVAWTNPDGTVSGYWIQNCTGTLADAKKRAIFQTSTTSEFKNEVAVVDDLPTPVPILEFWENRQRLDLKGKRRIKKAK